MRRLVHEKVGRIVAQVANGHRGREVQAGHEPRAGHGQQPAHAEQDEGAARVARHADQQHRAQDEQQRQYGDRAGPAYQLPLISFLQRDQTQKTFQTHKNPRDKQGQRERETAYREEVGDGQAHQRAPDVVSRVLCDRNVALRGQQRLLQLRQGGLVVRLLVEDVLQLGQLLLDLHRERVLEDEGLVAHGRNYAVHLPAGLQHLEQPVVQVIVAVQAEPDRGTAQHGNDRERHLEAGDRVGRPGLPVAATRQQVEQQPEQRHYQQGGRYRAEDSEALDLVVKRRKE